MVIVIVNDNQKSWTIKSIDVHWSRDKSNILVIG